MNRLIPILVRPSPKRDFISAATTSPVAKGFGTATYKAWNLEEKELTLDACPLTSISAISWEDSLQETEKLCQECTSEAESRDASRRDLSSYCRSLR